jgi:hypothetical protein
VAGVEEVIIIIAELDKTDVPLKTVVQQSRDPQQDKMETEAQMVEIPGQVMVLDTQVMGQARAQTQIISQCLLLMEAKVESQTLAVLQAVLVVAGMADMEEVAVVATLAVHRETITLTMQQVVAVEVHTIRVPTKIIP